MIYKKGAKKANNSMQNTNFFTKIDASIQRANVKKCFLETQRS